MTKSKKTTMLIVEDDEVLLRALYLVFHESNYSIATASDGDTGIKMVEHLNPDVILLDLLLPKMSGFDFLKYVKSNPALQHIPIIILSNLGDQESIDRAKDLGASDYFVKASTNLDDLREKIARIFK